MVRNVIELEKNLVKHNSEYLLGLIYQWLEKYDSEAGQAKEFMIK